MDYVGHKSVMIIFVDLIFLIVLLKHQVIKKIIGEMVFCGCHFCKRGKYKKYNALKADKLYLSNKL